jgi:hypothetical protein
VSSVEREANDVVLPARLFHAVHELLHQEDAASLFALQMLRRSGVVHHRRHVEAGALIGYIEDERPIRNGGTQTDVLGGILVIAADDGVRERFAERDGNVERALARWELKILAHIRDQLDDSFDLVDVARNLDFNRDA